MRPRYQTPRVDRSTWTCPPPEGIEPGGDTPAILHGARVFSHNGVIINARNRIRADLSPDFRPPPSGHRILDYQGLPDPVPVGGHSLALATPAAWKNYFHWMIDCLPRLEGLELSSFDRIITPLCRPYHAEILTRLGLPPTCWLESTAASHYECSRLTALSPLPLHHTTPRKAAFLRNLLGVQPGRPSRLLYISRGDAWRRRILNESALAQELAHAGFEIITIGGLGVRQQAALFSEARAVIAPHGAALTNLVFAPAPCRVLELIPSNYHYHQYAQLCEALGHRYQALVSPTPPRDPDYRVDLATLRPFLAELLA